MIKVTGFRPLRTLALSRKPTSGNDRFHSPKMNHALIANTGAKEFWDREALEGAESSRFSKGIGGYERGSAHSNFGTTTEKRPFLRTSVAGLGQTDRFQRMDKLLWSPPLSGRLSFIHLPGSESESRHVGLQEEDRF
jgi:hypothetical protein